MKLFEGSESDVAGSETSVNGCSGKHEAKKEELMAWWHLGVLLLPKDGMCIHCSFFETNAASQIGKRKFNAKPELQFQEKSIQHQGSVTTIGVRIVSITLKCLYDTSRVGKNDL